MFVAHAGIQRISGQELTAVGINSPDIANLQIWRHNVEIPLQVFDDNHDGKLDLADELRFYAPKPGDRWNVEEVYWLVAGTHDGLRMATRIVAPTIAPVRTTALQRGVWDDNQIYDSVMAGPDGDHWFHNDVRVDPSLQTQVSRYPTFTAVLNNGLPLASDVNESSVFTLTTTVYDVRDRSANGRVLDPQRIPHRLQVQAGNATITDGLNDWVVDFGIGAEQNLTRTFTTQARTSIITITVLPGAYPNAVKFDKIYWQEPVSLNFGNQGATFSGVAGDWSYHLAQVPDGAMLYDITNPQKVVNLVGAAGSSFSFEDGPSPHDYILAGPGTLFSPRLAAHKPLDFSEPAGADAIYIAPAAFHAALQPLLDLRASQGIAARFVDVQDIYDAWSYGMVSAPAIRDFLRYAVAHWEPAPRSVVLVGDGTVDPHNYLGYGNPDVIPPYMANVDPWLKETPCENCYAQLDGSDPLSESAFLTDIWLGRFPVDTVDELQTVVAKIITYETATDGAAVWRTKSVQIADDYVLPNNQVDPAGNFPQLAESIIQLQPPDIETLRNYYNAAVSFADLAPAMRLFMESIQKWLQPDPKQALANSIAYLSAGAGLVTYTGHSNQWQWAATDRSSPYGRLLGVWDVSDLDNGDRLFITLSMTCYTSQFTIPAPYHFTLDEHLLLQPNGGAVAVWGSSGLSVIRGHDALQAGFYHTLWTSPPLQAKLGMLIQSGYIELVTDHPCCQDIAKTFLLLGDPLTPARVQPLHVKYLPEMHR